MRSNATTLEQIMRALVHGEEKHWIAKILLYISILRDCKSTMDCHIAVFAKGSTPPFPHLITAYI